MSPVLPAEFKALIPTSDDSICTVLVKYIRFQIRVWQVHKWMFDSDGDFTDEFKTELCKIPATC